MNGCYRDVLLMQAMLKDLTKISCGIVIHIQRGGKNINSGMNLYFQRSENRISNIINIINAEPQYNFWQEDTVSVFHAQQATFSNESRD